MSGPVTSAGIATRRAGTTSLSLPVLGAGCAPLGNLYAAMPEATARDIVAEAWRQGIRYFDTAPHYGQGLSERRLGDALRESERSDYLLSSKVGRRLVPAGHARERHGYFSPMPFDIVYDYGYDGVMRSFEDSLQRLGLDRIDILFLHDIGRFTHGEANAPLFATAMDGGYRALDELRRGGQVLAIGLGVNEWEVCEEAMDYGDWDLFLLAGRYTLLEQGALASFLPRCVKRGCGVVVGGPYNSGVLVTGSGGAGRRHYNYSAAPPAVLARVSQLEAVCRSYDVPLPAAALQFPLAHEAVISVIPGLSRPEHVGQTLDWFRHDIPADFWAALRDSGLLQDGVPLPVATA